MLVVEMPFARESAVSCVWTTPFGIYFILFFITNGSDEGEEDEIDGKE